MANVPTLGGDGGTAAVALSPNQIQVAPGILWTQLTKPPDGYALLVSGVVSGAQDQRVWGPLPVTISGRPLGATIGDSGFSHRITFVDIMIEQALAKVEKVVNTEEAHCTFSVAELTAETMRDALPGSYWNQPVATLYTTGNMGGADPLMPAQIRHTITVGGLRLAAPQTIAFISANRRIGLSSGPFSYVFCAYNAIGTEGFDAPFSRGKETVWRLGYEVIADLARTIGDQLWQCCVRQAT